MTASASRPALAMRGRGGERSGPRDAPASTRPGEGEGGTRIDGVRRRHRRRRARRPERGHPASPARHRAGARAERVPGREGFRDRRPHSLRGGAGAPGPRRADPRLAGPGRSAPHPRRRGPFPVPHPAPGFPPADAASDAQPGQLHHQPRQPLPLARGAGGGAGGDDLPRLSGGRGALFGRRRGARHRHRRHGHGPGRPTQGELRARRRAARPPDPVRRGLPGPSHQDPLRALLPA